MWQNSRYATRRGATASATQLPAVRLVASLTLLDYLYAQGELSYEQVEQALASNLLREWTLYSKRCLLVRPRRAHRTEYPPET